MSNRAFKKSLPQKTHRERSQPLARKKFGLLEKKKDYKLRAADYHKKQDLLNVLAKKASLRNEDEFYHKMITSKTKKGLHLEQRRNHFDHETQALMKSQDLGYIQFQKSINAKKLEKLKSGLHFVDDNDHVQETRHTIFVDSDQKVRDFDAVEHFDTVPEMINRPSNRMKKSTLESVDLGAEYDTKTLKKWAKARSSTLSELESRLQRQEKLDNVRMEMETQKALMGKGARKKVGVDSRGLAVYKWAARRSK